MEIGKKKPYIFVFVAGAFVIFFGMHFLQVPLSVETDLKRFAQNSLENGSAQPELEFEIAESLEEITEEAVVLFVEESDRNDSSVVPASPFVAQNAGLVATAETTQNQSFVASVEPSFAHALSNFNWNGFVEAVNKSKTNPAQIHRVEIFQEEFMHRITPFLEMEPRVPINGSCAVPPLLDVADLKCEGHGNAFSGSRRSTTPIIGILVQFGFGVDVLEVYLNEVYDVVDWFFIIESTRSHFRTLKKALMWEKVKDQERFRKFKNKIVHLVIDDAEAANANEIFQNSKKLVTDIWQMETLQETLRWSKFLQWNEAHKIFHENDLIGFGDADEIPSREMIHMMKHCDLNGGQIDIGIWFPYGHIHQAFKSDFPVKGHPYTLGDPTFWTLKGALDHHKNKKKPPGRMRGKSGHFLLGGMHMTHYGYLPYQLMRDVSCSECSPNLSQLSDLAQSLKRNGIRNLEIRHGATPGINMDRIVNLTSIANKMEEIAILPWFYDCNRLRYPVWEGGHDTRLD